MRDRHTYRTLLGVVLAVAGLLATVEAQSYRQQGVSPIFDGWEELPDGSRLFYFGYINRNPTDVTIPIGPTNGFSKAQPDRGQPTTFLPGRHKHVFTIAVKDPKTEITWTVKTDAGVHTANASFNLLYVLEERENEDPNAKPPVVTANPAGAKVGEVIRLAPVVTPSTGGRAAVVEGTAADAEGLTVYWSKYRGPGAVTFSEAPGAPKAVAPLTRRQSEAAGVGVFVSHCGEKPTPACGAVQARFSEPGEDLLRAAARQEEMQGLVFVRVTVNP